MFAFFDHKIVDPYALQSTEVVQNVDGSTYDVVARNLPAGSEVLKNFDTEAKANDFVTRIQDEIEALDNVAIVDVRTPTA